MKKIIKSFANIGILFVVHFLIFFCLFFEVEEYSFFGRALMAFFAGGLFTLLAIGFVLNFLEGLE
jgi:hypothetical protein